MLIQQYSIAKTLPIWFLLLDILYEIMCALSQSPTLHSLVYMACHACKICVHTSGGSRGGAGEPVPLGVE